VGRHGWLIAGRQELRGRAEIVRRGRGGDGSKWRGGAFQGERQRRRPAIRAARGHVCARVWVRVRALQSQPFSRWPVGRASPDSNTKCMCSSFWKDNLISFFPF
jgi:hypothetical protein